MHDKQIFSLCCFLGFVGDIETSVFLQYAQAIQTKVVESEGESIPIGLSWTVAVIFIKMIRWVLSV